MVSSYVPLLVPLQRLGYLASQHHITAKNAAVKLKSNNGDILDWFIHIEYAHDKGRRNMLYDAYHSNRLILLLDGMNEAVELQVRLLL